MSFRDLIGQEHVSRTLANAIAQGRVAHAFLFTGVRGVGKTTSARILAKALNCLDPRTAAEGGSEPCLECAACREIAEGLDVDVREIDGASYTGVDEIRKLQESLPYRPTRDRYKIFIVDEVHMLSQNAWNALLKTLEEPPPHVKFILATTEVHKVPVTILSRVQRFDFKMISSRAIAERIRYVLEREQIEADDQAVALIAREAAGSMRDALSLLDQVIAFNPQRLLGDEVARVLGVAGYAALLDIARAVLQGDAATALSAVSGLADQSCDLSVAARDLLGLLRDLVVAKLCGENSGELLDLSDDHRRAVRQLATEYAADDLLRVQQGFAKGFDDVVKSPEVRTGLEMLLARLALRPELVPLDRLLGRLSELEARLSGRSTTGSGSPPGRSGPAGGPGPRAPRQPPATGHALSADTSAAAPAVAPPDGLPPSAAAASSAAARPASPEASVKAPAPVASGGPAREVSGERPAAFRSANAAPRAPAPVASGLDVAPTHAAAPSNVTASRHAATVAGSTAALARPLAESSPSRGNAGGAMIEAWRRVLDHLGEDRPDLVAFLKHSVPLVIDADSVTLAYESGNVLEAAMRSDECVSALGHAALACFGRKPTISFQPVAGGLETLAESDRREREQRKRAAVHRAEQHPSVRDAIEILGARVKRVEVGEN